MSWNRRGRGGISTAGVCLLRRSASSRSSVSCDTRSGETARFSAVRTSLLGSESAAALYSAVLTGLRMRSDAAPGRSVGDSSRYAGQPS